MQKHYSEELQHQKQLLTKAAESSAAIEMEGAIAKAVQAAEV